MRAPTKTGAVLGSQRIALWLLATTSGCQTSQLIETYNEAPVADAKILKMGIPVEQMRDGSIAELVFPYAGQPVAITLDGSSSYDTNGKITGYRWLSGTRAPDAGLPPPWKPDGGTPPVPFLRMEPAGMEGALREVSPTIMVGAGVWAFSLWVVDDQGVWSSPDTIRFIVGDPPAPPRDGGVGDSGAGDGGVPQDAAADAVVADAALVADAANGANGADAAPVADAAPMLTADSGADAGDGASP